MNSSAQNFELTDKMPEANFSRNLHKFVLGSPNERTGIQESQEVPFLEQKPGADKPDAFGLLLSFVWRALRRQALAAAHAIDLRTCLTCSLFPEREVRVVCETARAPALPRAPHRPPVFERQVEAHGAQRFGHSRSRTRGERIAHYEITNKYVDMISDRWIESLHAY